jgi:hypothetical protein
MKKEMKNDATVMFIIIVIIMKLEYIKENSSLDKKKSLRRSYVMGLGKGAIHARVIRDQMTVPHSLLPGKRGEKAGVKKKGNEEMKYDHDYAALAAQESDRSSFTSSLFVPDVKQTTRSLHVVLDDWVSLFI